MRRLGVLVVILTLASTLLGSLGAVPAQEATPPADHAAGTPQPATFRAAAAGFIEVLKPSTANVVLGRIILQPGASIPVNPTDPSAVLVYTGTGELIVRVDVPMSVARAAARGGTPTLPEPIAADTEFTLGRGDSAFFPGSLAGEVRNAGTKQVVAWVVDIDYRVVDMVDRTKAAATPIP